MESKIENRPNRPQGKPIEIERWEGEGGHPISINRGRRFEPAHTVSGILRRLLVDWHLINASSEKS